MNSYFYLIFCFVIFSCNSTIKKEQNEIKKPENKFEKDRHEFIYQFENEDDITNVDIDTTIFVIKKRLDKFKKDYEIKKHNKKQIKVVVKTNNIDKKRFDRIISNEGKLEFWDLFTGDSFSNFFLELNNSLIKEKALDGSIKKNPLAGLVAPQDYNRAPFICQFKKEDTAAVSSFLNSKEARLHLPSEYYYVKFLWGVPDENNLIPLYGAKSNRRNKAPIVGESITNTALSFDFSNRPMVTLEMDRKGALIWERMTGEAFENRTAIAITINNIVYSAPRVASGPIKGGNTQVSGDFTLEEATDLTIILYSQKRIPKLNLLQYKLLE